MPVSAARTTDGSRSRTSTGRGFTLVELVIAMLVLAILLAILAVFIGGGLTLFAMRADRLGRTRAGRSLTPTLDALIESGEIRAGRIPNVISLDFVDTWVTDECLRLTELNLR